MISLECFKEMLKECNVSVDEEQIEVFRDLIDAQAELILDRWLEHKDQENGVK